MIPTWREALDVAIKNLKPGGNLLILDFCDGTDLPKWLRITLKHWLALFDVHYRPEMLHYLETIDGTGDGQLGLTSIAGRYHIWRTSKKMQIELRDTRQTTTPSVGPNSGTLDPSALHLEGPTDEDILPSFDTGLRRFQTCCQRTLSALSGSLH